LEYSTRNKASGVYEHIRQLTELTEAEAMTADNADSTDTTVHC